MPGQAITTLQNQQNKEMWSLSLVLQFNKVRQCIKIVILRKVIEERYIVESQQQGKGNPQKATGKKLEKDKTPGSVEIAKRSGMIMTLMCG